ncbi:hypothetical protein ACOSOMT5_P1357 [Acidiphilium sp. MT5]
MDPMPDLDRAYALLQDSPLFDAAYYRRQNADIPSDIDPITHFCQSGWREGRYPNPYFDPAFYQRTNPDIARAEINPLVHYLEFGDREGRLPSARFDPAWYRDQYGLGADSNALADFLERRHSGKVSPVPLFDPTWYLDRNPDVAASRTDPFEHFCAFGVIEGRDPSPDFDVKFYRTRYASELGGENPLLHYLAHRQHGFLPLRPRAEQLIAGAVRAATRPGPNFETVQPIPASAPRQAMLLAYYLPQFHPIPENDSWWGTGFTDWTNLARATPRFYGHYQPRIPRDLGFYALDDDRTLRRQIALARGAGIAGMVFYYYWFNGHRLLQRPLEQFLAERDLDHQFCLMWANENWTRRWDGLSREVLIEQDYRDEDDIALIDDFARHFADPRYIRLEGRPLLMVYRAALIPDAAGSIARWRALFAERHGENPIMMMAQSFHDYDPKPYGLDGAVEFPPHKLIVEIPKINARLDRFDPEFDADVYDYNDVITASLNAPDPDYPLIRTAVPGWDNDPRREGHGVVLHQATPSAYQRWLTSLIERARATPVFGQPIVCINAWNEWAEGAYLEPDLHFGAAFLNATGRAAIGETDPAQARQMLLIGHDALVHGAQLLLLHIARAWRRAHGIAPRIILLGGGPLVDAYQSEGSVTLVNSEAALQKLVASLATQGITHALVNSAAAARVCQELARHGIEATLLIHEMPRLIQEKSLRGDLRLGFAQAARVVFSSSYVRDLLDQSIDVKPRASHILPQGNYQRVAFSPEARAAFRAKLGLTETDYMVLGVGFADLRKGFDLFLHIARQLLASRPDIHFVWMGEMHLWTRDYLCAEITTLTATGRFHRLEFENDVMPAYAAADIYALTSREDPLPSTVIEALAAGVPSVAFEGAGGIPDLLRSTATGRIIAAGDLAGFAEALSTLCDHAALAADRERLAAIAAERFDFARYAQNLLNLARPDIVPIGCAVPNYNYGHYLPERLNSIFAQTYPLANIVMLDDASSDNSIAIAEHLATERKRDLSIHRNPTNSGSVFAQWRRAAALCDAEYIWIAEADDSAQPQFLARLAAALRQHPDAVMAISDACAIDEHGAVIMPDYQRYFTEAGAPELSRFGRFAARDFAQRFLAERNLILNVSGVLMRKDALAAALDRIGARLGQFKLAGDWLVYLEILAESDGCVLFLPEALNRHRRHASGVTQSLDAARHIAEIAAVQEIARERLDLDAGFAHRQRAYRDQLAIQLGVEQAAIAQAEHALQKPR